VRKYSFIASVAVTVFAQAAVAQVAADEHKHDDVVWSDEREAAALAKNIDKAIQACDVQITEPTPEARAAQQNLTARGIHFQDTAPAVVMSANGTMGRAKYHQWFDAHATIWLTAYLDKPACRVIVYDSRYVVKARPEIGRLAQVGNFWQRDEARSVAGSSGHRDYYVGTAPANVRWKPILIIAGPIKVIDDPNGVQLMALVGLLAQ
jgi:hypothetical protein